MPPGAETLARLLARARASATVSYDPNCRPLLMGAPDRVSGRVHALVALADVVKVSAEDLAWLLPGRAPEEIVRDWLGRGPAVVAVTLGREGVAAARHTGMVRRPGRPVAVVDTVGAGDAFSSAFLAGLYRRDLLGPDRRGDLEAIGPDALGQVLDEAVLASAITCTRHGADPPTTDDLAAGLPWSSPTAAVEG